MKEANKNPIESRFQETLKDHELPFDPLAWDLMKELLDQDDDMAPVIIVPPISKNKPKFLILFIMTSISLLTISTYLLFNSGDISSPLDKNLSPGSGHSEILIDKNSALSGPETHPFTDSSSNTGAAKTSSAKGSSTAKSTIQKSNRLEKQPGQPEGEKPLEEKQKTAYGMPGKDSVSTVVRDGQMYRLFMRQRWVEDRYEYTEKTGLHSIDDGFIGIHFTAENQRRNDSARRSAGFNIQVMSGNRLPNPNLALYGGFDFGMQFYGSGKKSNVVLNNTSLDSGYTKLQSFSFDFLGRVHLEYAKYRLIPYVNLMAGPRLYHTSQLVESYIDIPNTDSRTSNSAHTSVSMLYGFGFGARLKISHAVSIDARYEWINGSKVKTVDLNNSKFNGLAYDLKLKHAAPHLEQFKIGVIFNLSSKEYDKKLVEKGHYQIVSVDSLKMEASDTNVVFLPCNCIPCDKSSNSSYQKAQSTEEEIIPRSNSDSNSNNNNRNNSTPKNSFPGIKPPPSRPTEDNRR